MSHFSFAGAVEDGGAQGVLRRAEQGAVEASWFGLGIQKYIHVCLPMLTTDNSLDILYLRSEDFRQRQTVEISRFKIILNSSVNQPFCRKVFDFLLLCH
jgi:hypothetical protein